MHANSRRKTSGSRTSSSSGNASPPVETLPVCLHRNDWETTVAVCDLYAADRKARTVPDAAAKFRDADGCKFVEAVKAKVGGKLRDDHGKSLTVDSTHANWNRLVNLLSAYRKHGAAARLSAEVSERVHRREMPKPDLAGDALRAAEVRRFKQEGFL